MSDSEEKSKLPSPAVIRTLYPEYRSSTEIQIEHFLGYLPDPDIYTPFEAYLSELIDQKNSGMLTDQQFDQYAEEHIRLIRNEAFKDNTMLDYGSDLYEKYQAEYQPYGALARDRICSILGYEPDLSRSLLAELGMREVMRINNAELPEELTPTDLMMMGLIRYREALLAHGKAAADNLPCLKCEPDWLDE